MRLLLDTHILLWRMAGSDRLSARAIATMDDEGSSLFASTASVWEVAIKWSLRKGTPDDMPLSGRDFADAVEETGLPLLPIEAVHAAAVDDLPMLHRDPFDRLLIATARREGLTLLTSDAQLGGYGEGVLVV